MKVSSRCVFAAGATLLAACCLMAGRTISLRRQADPPDPVPMIRCAGQALTLVRRRTRLAARRAALTLLLLLAAPVAALAAAARPELWTDLQPVAAQTPPSGRTLHLPGPARDRPQRPAPPGICQSDPARAGPAPAVPAHSPTGCR